MSKNYTSILEVMTDLNLFLAKVQNGKAPLGLYPAVAKNRWPWLNDNWTVYQPRFKKLAQGDQDLESALEDFQNAVTAYKLGSIQNALESNINYAKFLPFILSITTAELTLTSDEKKAVALEQQRVSKFDISDFRSMRSFLSTQIAAASALFGNGDSKGSLLFGGKNSVGQNSATFADWDQINTLIGVESVIEGIIFGFRQTQDRAPNLLAAAQNNIAPGSEVLLKSSYTSYQSVPFFQSLEIMAQEYLGDAQRWFELVEVNKLQPPYVDEYGTKLSLTAPGSLTTVTITGGNPNQIQVGQKVGVGSLTYREETRTIEKKVVNEDGSMTLSLSGEQTLSQLKPSDNAFVRAFSPNTVNGGSFILIPKDVRQAYPTPTTPMSDQLRRLDKDLLAFGVDIARDEGTGDVLVDHTGNFQMAVGLANVRQTLYWLFRTPVGEIPWHADHGLNMAIGFTYLGSEDELSLLSSAIADNITADPRFSVVNVSGISVSGTSISLRLLVGIGQSSVLLPLDFVG